MKKAGVLLIALGLYSVFLAFNMDVVAGKTYNIGLLNERQNIVYLSGVLFLAGIMLFGFGVVSKEESKNLKMFALWTFLSPLFLILAMNIVTYIQNKEAEEIKIAEKEREVEQVKLRNLKDNIDKFIDNKNGTITFKENGLMWQRCSVGQTWTGENCSGNATILTWDDAMKLTNNFAGYNDWRLPTKEELMTLVFCSDGEYESNGSCVNVWYSDHVVNSDLVIPVINPIYFPNTQTFYWSSTIDAYDSCCAWFVTFFAGVSNSVDKSHDYKSGDSGFVVRLVR